MLIEEIIEFDLKVLKSESERDKQLDLLAKFLKGMSNKQVDMVIRALIYESHRKPVYDFPLTNISLLILTSACSLLLILSFIFDSFSALHNEYVIVVTAMLIAAAIIFSRWRKLLKQRPIKHHRLINLLREYIDTNS